MSDLIYWFLFLPPVLFVAFYILLNYFVQGEKSVCVVVLGDFGRSPRMQYHCISLAAEGYHIDVVCYGGSKPYQDVVESDKIEQHVMTEPPKIFNNLPSLLKYVFKVKWQNVTLAVSLLLLPKSSHIIVQNPPAIPSLAVVWFVCLVRGSSLVIDWHNYGYTVLGLTLGDRHPLVIFSKWYEGFFGKFSQFNICVTQAMKKDLQTAWSIQADVLYDRPPEMFKNADLPTKHKLFTKLSEEYELFGSRTSSGEHELTAFTEKVGENIRNLDERPALLVSSTSWTEDEDFSILLSALEDYDNAAKRRESGLPDVICAITGSADLGVCLHKSSSGLDLPMKVVDMFGCGLPVCAVQFDCLYELVKDGHNGMVFRDSQQLADQIQALLRGFPVEQSQLNKFRNNLKTFQAKRWHENWQTVVLPLLKGKWKDV